jgi:hypothetical protein
MTLHIDTCTLACHPTSMGLLEQVNQPSRTKHCSARTEEAYVRRIERVRRFPGGDPRLLLPRRPGLPGLPLLPLPLHLPAGRRGVTRPDRLSGHHHVAEITPNAQAENALGGAGMNRRG